MIFREQQGGPVIKNILWDFDGTLFDTYPAIARAMQRSVSICGYEVPYQDVLRLCKISLSHCMRILAERSGCSFAEIEDQFDALYPQTPAEDEPPFPGVRAVLEFIVGGGGKNIIITHRGSSSLQKLLHAYQMDALFHAAITADDGFPRKPDPSAFLAVLRSYQLSPAETLGIGDRALDIEAARAAGISTAFYGSPPEDLPVDRSIDSYEHFLQTLRA